jgi:hypothetical protein
MARPDAPDADYPIWLVEAVSACGQTHISAHDTEAAAAGAVLAARQLELMATAWNLWDGKELWVNA